MEKKNRNLLLILNILYTIFSILAIVAGCIYLTGDESNILLLISVVVIFTLATIGIWLFYSGKINISLLLLRLKKIIKYITILVVMFILVMILFAAQDCSVGANKEVTLIERLSISWPFIVIAIFATIYLVTYFIFYKKIQKEDVSRKLSITLIVENIIYIIGIIGFTIYVITQDDINILLIILEIIYVSVLVLSSLIIYNKYLYNTFDKNN